MWSNKYYYINICADTALSEDCDTSQLVTFLKSIPELIQVKAFVFKNKDKSLLWFDLLLVKARNYTSWSDKDSDKQRTNLIVIVCAKGEPEEFQKPKEIFIKIAAFLNWQLIDEQTDEGIENFVIWQPGSLSNN